METWIMIGIISPLILFIVWVFVNAYFRFKFVINTVGEQLALEYKKETSNGANRRR